ncbi:MAG: phosphonopyruvate decarboxylase [Xanthomonadales bacterium]|nr:phosphonopyruvate decarboxylase [Gammaproteobacteria bacterium]NNK04828.1 phosphonopyruvate decarboxylase [Xanthomonadales bacterium]
MLEASQFVGPARRQGFDFWAGVPCSFLTPFINYTIGDEELTYISAANEGDAVAMATGAALGGRRSVAMMQNSGLGNAVSPLTSLNYVFRIPVLLIITLRGEPGRPDEPQHELMGQITPQLLETMRIPWGWFPDRAEHVEAALQTAVDYMDSNGRPYALVMKKGMVCPYPLGAAPGFEQPGCAAVEDSDTHAAKPPSRHAVLQELVASTAVDETVLIASTGFCGRELYAIADRPNQLYMVGSMGCASSLALGLASVRPDRKIIVVDGDGAALMRMGNMATAGAYGGRNFYHLLLDNHVHESTGGQATVSPAVDFASIARACGYQSVLGATAGSRDFAGFLQADAPAFMSIETGRGVPQGLPRPSVKPAEVARRLMRTMAVETTWASGQ